MLISSHALCILVLICTIAPWRLFLHVKKKKKHLFLLLKDLKLIQLPRLLFLFFSCYVEQQTLVNTCIRGCIQVLVDFFHSWITEKQGMVEVGRDLWSNPFRASCPDHVKIAFEYLQGWRLHNFSGQPVQVLSHPHSKKVFPDVQTACPVFLFVPIASGPVTALKRAWVHPLRTLRSGIYTH